MATPSPFVNSIVNLFDIISSLDPKYSAEPGLRASVQEAASLCEESWSVWDAVTSHQVRASNLPLILVDAFLERISEERTQFYLFICLVMVEAPEHKSLIFIWERFKFDVVNCFIENLMVLLRSCTTQAEEEDMCKQLKAAELMHRNGSMFGLPFQLICNLLSLLPGSTRQESLMRFCLAVSTLLYAVVVSSVSLLLFVYRYLTGYVHRGGTLTCSSGSSQFRATFICVLLYDGAYVWIKFRDAASTSSGGKRRSREDEPSETPTLSKPRKLKATYTQARQSGKHIYLSECNSDEEKKVRKRIAACLDGRDDGQLVREDGLVFQVPLKLREEGEGLSGKEKRIWLAVTHREVYKSFINASHHPPEDDANFFSFLNEAFFGSSSQEMLAPDSLNVSQDVYNGVATSNEMFIDGDGVLQESASIVDGARMSSFLPAQHGMQDVDVAIPAGVNFGIEESKPDVFAMMLIRCQEKEKQELKQEKQELKQKYQNKKQRIRELEQRLQEVDNENVELKRANELLRALT